MWQALGIAVLVLMACGGSSSPRAAGQACAHADECGAGAICTCPQGERSCPAAVCVELCETASDGGQVCPTGGACTLQGVACCEGVPSCTLNCLHDYACAP